MTIIECLKKENSRLTLGNRWLVWDEIYETWYVYEHKYRAKKSEIIHCCTFEEDAIRVLTKEGV